MRVACIFGGRSVEHEVSVITAHQVMAALSARHVPVPVYIAKDGRWFCGEALRDLGAFADGVRLLASCTEVTPLLDPRDGRVSLQPVGARRGVFGRGVEVVTADVAMPLVHGSGGEDGTLQGVLEMAGVAYTGSDVAACAVAMDKRRAKQAFRAAGLPVLDDVLVTRSLWEADREGCITAVRRLAGGPWFVKPLTLGSSIGVARAVSDSELAEALAVALTYDDRCLVEVAQENIVEVNCGVLGDGEDLRASLLEQPLSRGLLTYDQKYRGGASKGMKSARRLIPAPLEERLTARITGAAMAAFTAVGASGVARVDVMLDPAAESFVVNEINVLPGSLSFYLFEPAGVSFVDLLDEMLAIAQRRHTLRAGSRRVFDTWMLDAPAGKSG
ncbi:MAG: D-alanine--D-alanine ligase [Candidatus Dormibacteria bacterium]